MLHTIFNTEIAHNQSTETSSIIFGAGCFWGVERKFWSLSGVVMTSVGYSGGDHESPTYELVCAGITGHAEVVRIDYNPAKVSLLDLLKVFWECHDPTQKDRQGADVGTQYRSAVYYHSARQKAALVASRDRHQERCTRPIATEIVSAVTFWPAEDYHQQYLEKRGLASCHLPGSAS